MESELFGIWLICIKMLGQKIQNNSTLFDTSGGYSITISISDRLTFYAFRANSLISVPNLYILWERMEKIYDEIVQLLFLSKYNFPFSR